jgi:F-type H+-transporting ATPase subunit delta
MSKVASRYAKSLFDLSIEKGSVEKVYADMKLVATTCQENHDLRVLLKSPIVKSDKKLDVFKAIFGSKVDKLTMDFINILTHKRREIYLDDIATEFVEQYKKHKNVLTAIVTTAYGLDDELRKKVLDVVKKSSNSEVELVEKIDKDLIGGFIIRVGDKQDDTSISRKLKSLYRTFNENPYIKEF